MEDSASINRRASQIRLLLMDCDGVLTDGSLLLSAHGDEQKEFNVRDGQGIVLLHRAGLKSGIISGRTSSVVERRALELGMELEAVYQGVEDKVKAFQELLAHRGITANEVAFVGDDVSDIPLLRRVGFSVAVADAVPEARSAAHYITSAPGGRGAVREVIEIILKAQGHWTGLMERYLTG